ncbi:MAG TPA: hypothetical protein VG325_13175 [Solirubrobacteraceae bacterium]|nr:hypothetical protein [Solirubrobacteraceae bacterium]
MLVSLISVLGYSLALVWGFVVFPHAVGYIRRHSRAPGGGGGDNRFHDIETNYWRTTLR